MTEPANPAAPSPSGVRSYDDLAERLRALRSWAGLSYRELHRRVVAARRHRGVAEIPSADTVHRCLQPGRTRMDVELVVDIARALLGEADGIAEWRQAYQAAAGLASEATVVSVADRLPPEPGAFIGRKDELNEVLTLARDGAAAGRPVVALLDGMAGVGKTSLALHAAHRLAADHGFDLTLWVNLRGYDADRPPADPAAVLDGFLRLLGVTGSQLAGLDLARRTATFRDLVAGRRALLVLDNATGDDQVRPLLPGGSTTTLVTSRRQLSDLPDQHRLRLAIPDEGESIDLLRGLVGRNRVAAEPEAATGIVAAVGRLPLALNVVGTRIAATPDWALSDHLDRLHERRAQLRLEDGVELALTTSYDELSGDDQRLLRLLGLHPGRDFTAYAAAALADVPLESARQGLAGLTAASLLLHRDDDRYEFHDLVRLFAANRGSDEVPKSARDAALGRLHDHYLHTAMLAMDHYAPAERYLRPRIADPDRPTPHLDGHADATEWLNAERANLLAVALTAPPLDSASYAVHLSLILFRYLEAGGHFQDAETLHVLAADQAAGTERGRVLNNVGLTRWRTGRHSDALVAFEEAIAIHRVLGDRTAEARVRTNCGIVQGLLGRHDEALDSLHEALAVHRESGDRANEALTCCNLGVTFEAIGQYDKAFGLYQEYLRITRETGNRNTEVTALANLASVHATEGRFSEAREYYEQALALAEDIGRRIYEPVLHNNLANVLLQLGEPARATRHYQAAHAVALELDDAPEQERAREGLTRCAASPDQPLPRG